MFRGDDQWAVIVSVLKVVDLVFWYPTEWLNVEKNLKKRQINNKRCGSTCRIAWSH